MSLAEKIQNDAMRAKDELRLSVPGIGDHTGS